MPYRRKVRRHDAALVFRSEKRQGESRDLPNPRLAYPESSSAGRRYARHLLQVTPLRSDVGGKEVGPAWKTAEAGANQLCMQLGQQKTGRQLNNGSRSASPAVLQGL